VRGLASQRATAILTGYPTARSFEEARLPALGALVYDGHHVVGQQLARTLVEAARHSVGRHHTAIHRAQVRYFCQDIDALRERIAELQTDIEAKLAEHPVGPLLTTIQGLGTLTAARIIAAVDDPSRFRHGAAFASYVGVPGTKHSGLSRPLHASLCPLGNARLRRALYMATLGAVRWNPWLRAYYERLRARGKLPKVALCAAMRKLLMAVYSVAKHKQPFSPDTRHVAPSKQDE